jgi:hypothetical protein
MGITGLRVWFILMGILSQWRNVGISMVEWVAAARRQICLDMSRIGGTNLMTERKVTAPDIRREFVAALN